MNYRGVVLDLDGTVLSGDSLLPGVRDTLSNIREAGVGVLFLTNNPTRPPAAYAERLESLGVEASPEEVVTSATATIAYLDDHHAGDDVFVIAEDAVTDQLRAADVSLVTDAREADTVVVGYDRTFSYGDMIAALRAFESADALVGTDPDITVPTPDGPVPGSGALINAVAGVVEREPDAVLGKPSDVTARLALSRLGLPAEDCVLVGDRLDTDIAMGNDVGMTTVLVRTGVTNRESDVEPDHVFDSLADALDVL